MVSLPIPKIPGLGGLIPGGDWDEVTNPSEYEGTDSDSYGGVIKLYKSPNLMNGDWQTKLPIIGDLLPNNLIHCYFKVPMFLKKGLLPNSFNYYWPFFYAGTRYIKNPVAALTNITTLETDKYLRLPYCSVRLEMTDTKTHLLYFFPVIEI